MATSPWVRFLHAATACFALLSPARGVELRVATFQADVTPAPGTPIYSGYQPLANIEHPLLAKGVVLDDGQRRYVLCAVDWCVLSNDTHAAFRRGLAEAVGTSAEYVAVQTVHQHTAPIASRDALVLLGQMDNPPPHPPPSMIDDALAKLVEAARMSIERFEPCDRIGLGQGRVERVASTRRNMVDGRIVVRYSAGGRSPELAALPEGKIDPYLKTLTFAQGDRPIARLHYYAVHPQSFYGDPRASYDFPGMARERLQAKEGVFQVYFTGCAGDVTAGKYNDGSPEAREQLAARLLAGMEAAIAATRYVPAPQPVWRRMPVRLPPRADPAEMAAAARALMHQPDAAPSRRIYRGAMQLGFLARLDTPLELSSLQGGWFALPDPGLQAQFAARYRAAHGEAPHPLAWLAYDGMAAVGALLATGNTDALSRESLTQPQGFAGVGGVFRLLPDGTNERGLAVATIRDGAVQVVVPAPRSLVGAGS